MASLLTVTKDILNLVYPLRCAACGRSLDASNENCVCASCVKSIEANPKPYCPICGHSLGGRGGLCGDCRRSKPAYAIARSACLYEGTIKELVHMFKYRNRRPLAAPLADIMADFLTDENGPLNGAELITFVPLHARRLYERGFNQSELLAQRISARFGLRAVQCLDKARQTRHQNELSREERLGNLKGVFRVKHGSRDFFRDKSILLVDDVMTTGATLDECSRTLLDAGVREVRCITLARGL